MNSKNMTPSQDGSPFDLEKSYIYKEITDYHKNKALQLINVKNYDLALTEFIGLNNSSEKLNDFNHNFKSNVLDLEKKIKIRNSIRSEFISKLNNSDSLNLKTNILKEFIDKSNSYEEYNHLQKEISYSNFDNIESKIKSIFSFDPLKYIIEIAKIKKSQGLKPFMLFDLDSTLFDNSPRVHKIIQDFINEHKDIYPQETQKMLKIKRQDIVWGIKENLKKVGLDTIDLSEKVIKYWFERFFSNKYVIDVPLRGANEFISDLEKTEIKIVYLTGRFESMRQGTERNILEHGFPLDKSGENLILKPDPKMPDHTFKHEAMENIKKFGEMIAGFENEPLNSNIFQEHFPNSDIFFLETNHSLNPPNLLDKVHTIRNFDYYNK